MVGLDAADAFCWSRGRRARAADGRRNDGGSRPQLRGFVGAMVGVMS